MDMLRTPLKAAKDTLSRTLNRAKSPFGKKELEKDLGTELKKDLNLDFKKELTEQEMEDLTGQNTWLVNQDVIREIQTQIREELTRNPPPPPVVQNVVDTFSYQAEIPTFSGDSSGPTFEEWSNKFEAIARCAGWNDARKLQVFPSKLTSTAFDFYRQLEISDQRSTTNYATLKNKFLERFKETTNAETYLTRFHAAYKLPSESLKDFAQRLEKLFYKAIPRTTISDQLADYQLKIRFVSGLEPRLQRYVRSANPADFKTAIVVATREEENEQILQNQIEKEAITSAVSNPKDDLIVALIQKFSTSLEEQKNALQNALEQNKEIVTAAVRQKESNKKEYSNKSIECYNCGRKGHIAAQCKTKQQRSKFQNNNGNRQQRPAFCHHCKKPGHTIYKCVHMSSVLQENIKKLKCTKCGEMGHILSNCNSSN
jgi:Zinc knuckle